MKLYYKKPDGSWINKYEIETAFYLSTLSWSISVTYHS